MKWQKWYRGHTSRRPTSFATPPTRDTGLALYRSTTAHVSRPHCATPACCDTEALQPHATRAWAHGRVASARLRQLSVAAPLPAFHAPGALQICYHAPGAL